MLIPGCIASTSNYVEHPRLIAEQLCQYADIVGRERVIAGTDCGFGSFAGYSRVDPGDRVQETASARRRRGARDGQAMAKQTLDAPPRDGASRRRPKCARRSSASCAAACFENAGRASDFLRFVVGETLAGEADRLKGYTIAV